VDAFPFLQLVILASLVVLGLLTALAVCAAQETYGGGLIGISTFSADTLAVTSPTEFEVSLYKRENGRPLNFSSMHT